MPPASSSASASVRDFLVQQELPEHPLQRAQDSLRAFERQYYHHPDKQQQPHQQQQQQQRRRGGCSCPHWRDVLPRELDLSFCPVVVRATQKKQKPAVGGEDAPSETSAADRHASTAITTTTETAWMLKNPVHALHLQSQLDEDATTIAAAAAASGGNTTTTNNNNNNNTNNNRYTTTSEPVLYGAEQERLFAVRTEGLAESWHPWMEASDPPPPPPPPITTATATSTAGSNNRAITMAADSRSAIADATKSNDKRDTQIEQQQRSATLSSVVSSSAVQSGSPQQPEQQPQQSSTTTTAAATTTAPAPVSSTATTKIPGDGNSKTTTTTTTTTTTMAVPAVISSTSNAPSVTAAASPTTAPTPATTSIRNNQSAAAAAASTVPKEASASATTTTSTSSKPAPLSLSTSSSSTSPLSASNLPPSTSPLGAPPGLAVFGAPNKPLPPPPPPPQSAAVAVASNSGSTSGAAPVVPYPSSGCSSSSAAAPAPAASTTTDPTAAASGTNTKTEPDPTKPDETASTAAPTNQALGTQKQPQEQHSENNKKKNFSLPDDQYMALHAAEEQILQIRRHFLSKRRALVAPTSTTSGNKRSKASSSSISNKSSASSNSRASDTTVGASNRTSVGADRKRKVDSGGAALSLQAMMSAKKLPQHDHSPSSSVSTMDLEQYTTQQERAERTVAVWMEHFRWNRQAFWREKKLQQQQQLTRKKQQQQPLLLQSPLTPGSVFGAIVDDRGPATATTTVLTNRSSNHKRCCQECHRLARQQQQHPNSDDGGDDGDEAWLEQTLAAVEEDTTNAAAAENEVSLLFQCLECSFVGCAPASVAGGRATKQHMVQHLVQSNHKYAVSCGQQAQVYCFQCGDFVCHPIFDQEKERIDLTEQLPWQAWKEHAVQRSFDALQFFRVQDHGVFWRGMVATYPPLAPKEHVRAARACLLRQQIFRGELDGLLLAAQRPETVRLSARQQRTAPRDRWRVPAPVGMYNLGLSCFMSSILQCLIHCVPLQWYFLKDTGHNHEACALYRKKYSGKSVDTGRSKKTTEIICLACEMDKLFLRYMGSAIGVDVLAAVRSSEAAGSAENTATTDADGSVVQGDPLITSTMLSTAWKCGGLKHLAGYGQRDAHEFLHGFLEFMGRHVQLYRTRMYRAINAARPANSFVDVDAKNPSQFDEIKTIFEGTLRSVLVCLECGTKRFQSEPFMSISLPLSKEVQNAAVTPAGIREKLSVELCLRHFTMPEMLTDPVVCQTCGKKTPTKKQHVVSKLPKILCLHLKRFDAALNRKIEDFVAFPSKRLNMGQYLPHWCEVSRVATEATNVADEASMPQINYDLFGTVNHYGNLQSGHYVTNLKVKDRWFHCNDAHVSHAGVGNGEAEVLKSEGAYLLFYERR